MAEWKNVHRDSIKTADWVDKLIDDCIVTRGVRVHVNRSIFIGTKYKEISDFLETTSPRVFNKELRLALVSRRAIPPAWLIFDRTSSSIKRAFLTVCASGRDEKIKHSFFDESDATHVPRIRTAYRNNQSDNRTIRRWKNPNDCREKNGKWTRYIARVN